MRALAPAVVAPLLVVLAAAAAACDKKADTSSLSAPELPLTVPTPEFGAHVTVGEHGFSPSSVSIPKGPAGATVPVTFERTTDDTCAKEVVFPALGVKKELPLRTPVAVDVPADSARSVTFQCGMGMYKGAVVVR